MRLTIEQSPISRLLLAARALTLIVLILATSDAYAGEKDEPPDKGRDWLSYVHDTAALASIGSIIVYLEGPDPYHATVARDALAIGLRKGGLEVVDPITLEQAMTNDLDESRVEIRKLFRSLPDSIRNDQMKLDSWLLALPDSVVTRLTRRDSKSIVADLVDADAYLTGTVLVGRHQYSSGGKSSSAGSEKVVVTSVSLQIVAVSSRRPILSLILNYRNGQSASYAGEDIALQITHLRSQGAASTP